MGQTTQPGREVDEAEQNARTWTQEEAVAILPKKNQRIWARFTFAQEAKIEADHISCQGKETICSKE